MRTSVGNVVALTLLVQVSGLSFAVEESVVNEAERRYIVQSAASGFRELRGASPGQQLSLGLLFDAVRDGSDLVQRATAIGLTVTGLRLNVEGMSTGYGLVQGERADEALERFSSHTRAFLAQLLDRETRRLDSTDLSDEARKAHQALIASTQRRLSAISLIRHPLTALEVSGAADKIAVLVSETPSVVMLISISSSRRTPLPDVAKLTQLGQELARIRKGAE